ncbi:PspC domain-containing protein [Anaerobacillus sp. 1_MG-2023]|uniref:PspC domain-containing protein n=1 Tax=Bacillales TaxID=1385 RepID=UPI0026E2D5E4|nr:PspC domain-containing protein [Anaerobacillus sp. 1_MG-2023]MDO6654743.1 PspC domain-containing protein [Anaerobacillus sp. 1_MG-2023]
MKKIYKSTTNKKLAGVLGGLSEVMNVDANILRIAYIALTLLTSGIFVVVYLGAALMLPSDQDVTFKD